MVGRTSILSYSKSVHPFPARMASEVALKALEGLPTGSTVLDPMCGSGVVVRRALDCRFNSIGIDIDPLAILMARLWTTKTSQSIKADFGLKLTKTAIDLIGTPTDLEWIDRDQPTTDYIDFWYAPHQRDQIRALLKASEHLRGQRRDLVRLALSRIIITKTKGASLAADTSHSRPHRVQKKNSFDVFSEFAKSFDRLIRILRDSPVHVNGKILRGDARTLRGVRSASVDAVVTSPPYMNAIDYLRGHKLALVWLGYTTPSIRQIKSLGVGAPKDHQKWNSKQLEDILMKAINRELTPKSDRTVRRYTYDMLRCLKQSYRVLKPTGYAVYVVSNSMLNGVEVDTAKIIIEVAAESGFQLIDCYTRDIPRKHRYLPPPQTTTNPNLSSRMRTESVLRFKKNIGHRILPNLFD